MSSQTKPTLPNPLDHEMWRPHLQNADYPQTVPTGTEARVRKIEEENAIRDLMVKYCYNYDSNNVDGVVSVFDKDCTLVNPRGTFIGGDAVRRCYEHLTTTRRYSFHHVTNVTIRLSDDMTEAVTTTYWTDKHVGPTGAIDGSDGTYADHLRKVGSEWKITQRRITANIFYVITPLPDAWPPVPEPTTKDNTRAWVGAKYMR